MPVPEPDLGQQYPLGIEIHPNVFETHINRVRRQRVDRLLRRLDQRHIVHQIQAHSNVFTSSRFHPSRQLLRPPTLMILNRQPHLVLPQNRLHQPHTVPARRVEGMELCRALELFVPPSAERIVNTLHPSTHLRAHLHRRFIPRQIRLCPRRPHQHHQPHIVLLNLCPQLRDLPRIQIRRQRSMRVSQALLVRILHDVPILPHRPRPRAQPRPRRSHVSQSLWLRRHRPRRRRAK